MPLLYLFVESKLNRLEGADKRKLKSKDILSALSEARDDHLSQPATLNVTNDNSPTNDPWSSASTTGRFVILGVCVCVCVCVHMCKSVSMCTSIWMCLQYPGRGGGGLYF